MNTLVSLLREQRGLIDNLSTGNEIAGQVLEQLLERTLPDIWAAVADDEIVRRQLEACYLPVLDYAVWEGALRSASRREPLTAPEWVTFVRISRSTAGITLPQDGAPDPRASMFWRTGDRTHTLSLELASGTRFLRMSTSVGTNHCGMPADGRCDRGDCGGCIARTREEGGEWGLICWCGHY